jgi:hypothetical protein
MDEKGVGSSDDERRGRGASKAISLKSLQKNPLTSQFSTAMS